MYLPRSRAPNYGSERFTPRSNFDMSLLRWAIDIIIQPKPINSQMLHRCFLFGCLSTVASPQSCRKAYNTAESTKIATVNSVQIYMYQTSQHTEVIRLPGCWEMHMHKPWIPGPFLQFLPPPWRVDTYMYDILVA